MDEGFPIVDQVASVVGNLVQAGIRFHRQRSDSVSDIGSMATRNISELVA